jgi:hypothetical protein
MKWETEKSTITTLEDRSLESDEYGAADWDENRLAKNTKVRKAKSQKPGLQDYPQNLSLEKELGWNIIILIQHLHKENTESGWNVSNSICMLLLVWPSLDVSWWDCWQSKNVPEDKFKIIHSFTCDAWKNNNHCFCNLWHIYIYIYIYKLLSLNISIDNPEFKYWKHFHHHFGAWLTWGWEKEMTFQK